MLGAHSIRKGSITIFATGCTVSPPMASICLRAGWSTIPIKDQYTHYKKVGDQFVGRSVTGISSLSKDFGISPVHWDFTDPPPNLKHKMATLIEENLMRSTDMPGPMFELLKYLFPWICFHY